MNDLVSVIVPIYGVEKWLDECITSIVKQTYKNLEIILVDDGSKDRCPQICDEWREKDKRIKVIHKENGGLASARNAGIEICTGDYIGFVDSDDYIESDMYELLVKDIKEKDVDFVKFSFYRVLGEERHEYKRLGEEKMYNSEEMLDCFFWRTEGFCGSACDKLYKADLLKSIRFPEGLNSEDYLMLVELYNTAKNAYYNNRVLYNYRMREESICTTKVINHHTFDKILISDKIYKYAKEKMPKRIEDAVAFQVMSRFEVYYETMFMKHTKKEQQKWCEDLESYWKAVKQHTKLSTNFKFKYYCLTNCPKLYIGLKKMLRIIT